MNIKNSSTRGSSEVNRPLSAELSTELRQRLASLVDSAADQVSLSGFSAALQAAGTNSSQQTARLAQLSAAAADQSYRIEAPAVSESIINQHIRA